jgi:hypothetical protein
MMMEIRPRGFRAQPVIIKAVNDRYRIERRTPRKRREETSRKFLPASDVLIQPCGKGRDAERAKSAPVRRRWAETLHGSTSFHLPKLD